MINDFLDGKIGLSIHRSLAGDVEELTEIISEKNITSFNGYSLYEYWLIHDKFPDDSFDFIFYNIWQKCFDAASILSAKSYVTTGNIYTAAEILGYGNIEFKEINIDELLKGE